MSLGPGYSVEKKLLLNGVKELSTFALLLQALGKPVSVRTYLRGLGFTSAMPLMFSCAASVSVSVNDSFEPFKRRLAP
jgi:hypothetical protein